MRGFSKYFQSLEDCGIPCGIPCASLDLEALETAGIISIDPRHIQRQSHLRNDWVQILLRKLPENLRQTVIQNFADLPYPGFFKSMAAYQHFRRSLPFPNPVWEGKIQNFQPDEECDYSVIVLDREKTNVLLARRKSQGIHSFFLHPLARSIDRNPQVWMNLVVLKSLYSENEPDISASFFDVTIVPDLSVSDLDSTLTKELRNHSAWGTWFSLELFGMLPRFLRQKLIPEIQKSTRRTGVYSNFGRWNFETNDREFLFAFTPPLPETPVAANTLMWNGRLILAVSIHPALKTVLRSSDVLSRWLKSLNFDEST